MTATKAAPAQPLFLAADTAADLMMPNPVSLRAEATVLEAIALLTDKGFSAAPVIDEAGRPVGVVSRADIIVHDREKQEYLIPVPEEEEPPHAGRRRPRHEGYQIVNVDRTAVRDIMTPIVFSVRPDTPAGRVVDEMLSLKVHRLFVVDEAGILVGVISTMDVLGCLRV
jgi:CBS-domain-containing membrane protein